jgi:exo-beta-1,3-glucanase (GH17 family)
MPGGQTGWPSATDTPSQGAATPSPQNRARYLREFVTRAGQHHVTYFYFEAFDEGWKKTHEHGVGR